MNVNNIDRTENMMLDDISFCTNVSGMYIIYVRVFNLPAVIDERK